MPFYDFKCNECSHVWEVTKSMTAPGPDACPKCGGRVVSQVLSCPSIIYANRPPWTYKDCLKFKDCRLNDGPRTKIDPNKHGDLGAWHSPGDVVPLKKGEKPVKRRRGRV